MPEMTPSERREMKGAIPKVAPAAACRGGKTEYWGIYAGLEKREQYWVLCTGLEKRE
jgi:hypothetical protein